MIVSLGIIALNEEGYLCDVLQNIVNQNFPLKQIDFILIDGMSTDSTKTIMDSFRGNHREEFYDIRVFENKGQWLAKGWNIFINNAVGDVLIKVDAHSLIPPNFITLLVKSIEKDSLDVIGGKRPTILKEQSNWSKILLEAENALFGSGLAVFRTSDKPRFVKSVFHGAYRKEVFEKIGMFNETLRRTEDNEIHYRIRKGGYRIKYDPSIVSYQYARPTLMKMIQQKYLNGYWIGKTVWVCPLCFSVYHFVPLLFVVSLIFSSIISFFSPILFIVLICLYGIFDLINTIISAVKNKSLYMFSLFVIFPMLHISYGIGTLLGLLSFPNRAKNR